MSDQNPLNDGKSRIRCKKANLEIRERSVPDYKNTKMCCGDAVDENKLTLCCALCCVNCSTLPCLSMWCGLSGKVGCCGLDCEVCLKPGAEPLPLLCCGPTCDCDGCKVLTSQCQCCCVVCNTAIPCNDDVPVAIVVGGLMCFPKRGCCVKQREIMER